MSVDLMSDLLDWCRERREQDKYRSDMMRVGKIRLYEDGREVTEREIGRLTNQMAELDGLIARLAPQNPRLR